MLESNPVLPFLHHSISMIYALSPLQPHCYYDFNYDTTDNDPQLKGADSSIFMEEVCYEWWWNGFLDLICSYSEDISYSFLIHPSFSVDPFI